MTTYTQAGVDIDAGERFAFMIKQRVEIAWPKGGQQIGRFAGQGDIPMRANIVAVSCDGAGTKSILAASMEKFDGIGQDAVAMSAVDTYVAGALPLYLVDVLAVGKLKPDVHIAIIDSIIEGCLVAGCRLIGGETAEHPGMFRSPWMIDLNTTAIGFPHPNLAFIPLEPGQRVYGWPSYGPACNGFSLLRNVFGLTTGSRKEMRQKLERYWPELNSILADRLLRPAPIWIQKIEREKHNGVKFAGHAHITGGGMPGNIPRILSGNPKVKIVIDRSSWPRPAIFRLVQEIGKVSQEGMDRTFNQGIMLVSVTSKQGPVLSPPAYLIGEVQRRKSKEPQVVLTGKYKDE